MVNTITGLEELKKFGYGSARIKIAVIDGPVDLQHPCFNTAGGKLVPLDTPQVQPSGLNGLAINHGTAVCSLIFGKPGSEVEGVAPGCGGIIIPIYTQDDNGNFFSASQVLLARAIEMAVEQGANIINISGGQSSKTGDPEIFLKQAIEKCYQAGVLIVAASGNEGCDCLHVPAADQQVLAVGSMDEKGYPTEQTNFGASYKVNGILAQGRHLTAARAGGGTFQTNGGTSYATPIVSGVVALLMSLQIRQGQKPDAYAVRHILDKTAIPCSDDGKTDCRRFMRGKLNIAGALEEIRKKQRVLAPTAFIQSENNIVMKPHFIHADSERSEIGNDILVVEPAGGIDEYDITNSNQTAENTDPVEISADNGVQPSHSVSEQNAGLGLDETNDPIDHTDQDPTVITSRKDNPSNNFNLLKSETMEQKVNMWNAKTSQANERNGLNLSTSAPTIAPSGEIDPSDCGCGGGEGSKSIPPAIVYALGNIGYDFGSESHRDSFIQSMGDGRNPHNPADLIAYLRANPWDASELLWTLNIDSTPIYALFPNGSHAHVAYERLIGFLEEQQNGNIQRISVPGMAEGTTSLLNGQTVTNLYPNLRGMYSWTTSALVASTAAGEKGASKVLAENVTNFLNRIYYKMRNLGVTAQERALNYSATNAYQVSSVFASAMTDNLVLDDISASKSPICRPGSDCYDVVLSFFNPRERLTQARKEYRFTVDVSDVVPVTLGEVRSWSVY